MSCACEGPRWAKSVFTKFSNKPNGNTYRDYLEHVLHAKWVHVLLSALLICDIILVVLGLELQVMTDQAMLKEYRKCASQYKTGNSVPAGLNNTLNNPLNLPVCQPRFDQAHIYHELEVAVASLSVIILTVFLLELFLHMLVLGLDFFLDFFYVLDLTVVSLSLLLELLFLIESIDVAALGGLIIIARTWRFARVAHGFYMLEHGQEHENKTIEISTSGTEAKQGKPECESVESCSGPEKSTSYIKAKVGHV